ncbi:MAG: ABC transporter permease subunit [Acholeplasmatales bacterium]|jgi:arabinogalactan oligomer/maltooligosaccharide transport system permease protein|nr:ABC transporter permease subunit [Acholeplasmatales bacterium]
MATETKPIVMTKKSPKVKISASTIISYAALIILSVIWLIPIVWMILTAFREEYVDGVFQGSVSSNFYPKGFGFENFRRLFQETQFLTWFTNTLIVAIFTTILSTLMVLMVSYAISKLRFKLRKPLMNVAMILGLFPGFMSIIAVYYILKAMGLTQSLFALVLCYSAGAGLGFYVAKGFFDIIPSALIESAKIDGASALQTFVKIILPLSKPIIIYTVLTSFTGPWMDFVFARVILGETNTSIHTVSVGLYLMIHSSQADGTMFSTFIAGCIIVSLPIVALFLVMQKYYVSGVTSGAVKG